ncbi:hypothetical protein CCR83_05140 [Rhodobacter veldkampii DSM 11550]|uniref:DUF2484 family protein n=1 Tax=Phaeovulum veldkampii DSM 11550 TaxID=1185920 RepID=A0A2T4JKN3_9RHOB|nr:DUF2484 family protein [Phaeovulum veldkampii]MBK5945850.1 hypothetical protein [Phaeovulum veldkampii DSM 11550]NCU21752.1 DUF2484 family protein [Candidatus Falkowbacteria bacterium]PTE18438.1 hypothetical protein C5F46_04585 [Phaeovulum veldkampii DSM 11550]TDQ59317.1 uncharacterized protein DUF2484 [Phaeovulum veldkampii DSM 11550]
MTASLISACCWALAASLIALAPARIHWPAAYGLVVVGVPVLGWVTYDHGPWVGLVVMIAGMSVLRWPVIYLIRRLRGKG